MKKTLLLTLALTFFILKITAQQYYYPWAKGAGSTGYDYGKGVAVDASGNVYVTGIFSSPTITFGSFTLTNSGNNYNIYVVKYDASGNVLWAQSAGGTGGNGDFATSISVAGTGVFVTGSFSSTSISFGSYNITKPGFFIVKYDASNGNVLWAGGFSSGTGQGYGKNCFPDCCGGVLVTGSFYSSITFGGITITSAGSNDLFIAHLESGGNVDWLKRAGGTGDDSGTGISTDGNGISVTGYFNSSSIVFGSTTLNNANASVADIFVAKYDNAGNVQWAKKAGGINGDFGKGIFVKNYNTYITGYFESSSITFGGFTLTNTGGTNVFVAAYDLNGTALWAKNAGTSGDNQGNGIAVDVSGTKVFVTGYFTNSITFDGYTLTNAGDRDVFVVNYDANGNVKWAGSAGGTLWDEGNSISAVGDEVSITGNFKSASINFGNDTLTNSSGNEDVFVAKICGISTPTITASGDTTFCSGDSVILNCSTAQTYLWSTGDTTQSITVFTSGNYSVTVNNNGCSANSSATTVTVIAPTASITANGSTTFCNGDSVMLSSSPASSYLWNNGATAQTTTVSVAGNYTVTITDADGCIASSAPISITVNPNPPIPTITQSGSMLVSSSATGNQWYFNSNLISGAIGQVYVPVQNGNYTVMVADSNSCSSTSAPFVYPPTGMNEVSLNEFLIFPNPTSDKLQISSANSQIQSIDIYNLLGEIIKQILITDYRTPITLDLSQQPKGIYFIQLNNSVFKLLIHQ